MRANMQYNETLVKLAKTFLANENVEVYFDETRTEFSICVDVHNNRIWTDGNRGLWSTVAKGVKVRHANFLVTYDEEDDYWSGGLAGTVHYDGSGEDGTWFDGGDVETALINKTKDMRESDGMIYTDTAFLDNLKKYMVESCNYDMRLEEYLDFDYSEQGMQDDEYVNLDVELDGTFWLYVIDEMQKEGIAHRRIGEEDLITEAVA
tara:strand:+ start:289 stop:906 length:618 start_codon:yes stop_codon:yes gene_type:complete